MGIHIIYITVRKFCSLQHYLVRKFYFILLLTMKVLLYSINLLLASSRHRIISKTKVESAYSEYFGNQPVLMEGEELEDTQVIFASDACKLCREQKKHVDMHDGTFPNGKNHI